MAKTPTIRRKPTGSKTASPEALEAFLSGNATEQENNPTPKPTPVVKGKRGRPKGSIEKRNFRLSLPETLVDRLDSHLSELDLPPSRNAWIAEAIAQRLNSGI